MKDAKSILLYFLFLFLEHGIAKFSCSFTVPLSVLHPCHLGSFLKGKAQSVPLAGDGPARERMMTVKMGEGCFS